MNITINILAQIKILMIVFNLVGVFYHRTQQLKEIAESITRKKINLKFFDYFNIDFLYTKFSTKIVQKIYKQLDLGIILKLKR
jgi:hypothetical protein